MTRIVCLGECMVEFAPVGDGLYRRGFAGDTFNSAWYLRRLLQPEAAVDYATCVGDDAISEAMRGFMASSGVGTASVRSVPGRTVGLYTISLSDGERSFSYWRSTSAARELAADPRWLADVLRGARLALFSGITLAVVHPGHRPAFLDTLAEARADGTTVAFDPNIRLRLWPDEATARDGLSAAAAVSDVLLPSFEDEAALFGDTDPEATLARYRHLGARAVIVKNGPGEMLAWDEAEGRATLTPAPVEVLDTTAAGDSFNAGYLAARLRGASLRDAIAAGAALAGKVCRSPGALVAIE